MYRAVLCLPFSVALASCGAPTSPGALADENMSAADGNLAATISALPERQQHGVFLRAVRDSGGECQEVTQATPIPTIGGAPSWAVSCDRSARFVVAIGSDGVATVTPASALPKS